MTQKVNTKTAIVTGGNSGLGFATAKKLCNNGIKTFIIGRTKDKTENACVEIGPNAIRVNCVAPGFIKTKMSAKALDNDPERKNKVLEELPWEF